MAGYGEKIKTALKDRRVQVGGAAALSALALLSVGVMAVLVAAKPEPAIAEMSDQARLSVVAAPPPKQDMPAPLGKLATLDPEQVAALDRPPEPLDPSLQAALVEERQEQVQAAAEQRAFDARLKADMADTPIETPDRPPEPARAHGSTSNSEDMADS